MERNNINPVSICIELGDHFQGLRGVLIMRMDLYSKGLFLCFFLVSFFNQANATDVSGILTQDTTWDIAGSPYVMTANVTVPAAFTLTIDPDVVVKFNNSTGLIIDGTLVARGTPEVIGGTPVPRMPVTFTSSGVVGELWRNISFNSSSIDATYDGAGAYLSGSIIEIAVIENAGNQSSGTINGAIELTDAHPFINDVTIKNNTVSGVFGTNLSSELKILNSIISGNSNSSTLLGVGGGGGGGIHLDGSTGSTAIINSNKIINNDASSSGGGIKVSKLDTINLINNVITGNQATGVDVNGGGVYVLTIGGTSAMSQISDNTIENNIAEGLGGGIWINDASVTIDNNYLKNNDAKEGGGLFIGASAAANNIVSNNMYVGNFATSNGGSSHINGGSHSLLGNVFYKNTTGASGHGAGIDVHQGASTFTGNIIAENTSNKEVLNMLGVIMATGNSIVNNTVSKLVAFRSTALTNFSSNTIVGNNTPGNLIGIENTLAVASGNNIFNNNVDGLIFVTIDTNLNADSNWWGTTVVADIQNMVGSTSGNVSIATPLSAPITTVPVSPPEIVSVVAVANGLDTDVTVTWNANPEADVIGYNVYWGTKPLPNFEFNSVPLGLVTSYTFTIPSTANGIYYVGVTAFDAAAGQGANLGTTIVNEDQTAGVESWYSLEQTISTSSSDLEVAIETDVSGTVFAGDQITYTATITNNGPDIANNITMVSVLPAGSGFVSASSGCAETNGTVTCSLVGLAIDSAVFNIVATAAGSSGTQTNSVSVSSIDTDLIAANNTASVDTIVTAMADLSVSVNAPTTVTFGETFTYEALITNVGPSTATNLIFTITLPDEVIFVSSPASCSENTGIVTCNIASLNTKTFNNPASFNIVVTAPSAVGFLTSSYAVSADEADNTIANNTMTSNSTAVTGDVDLSVSISAEGAVTAGNAINYEITVTNNGPGIVINAVVDVTIPAGSTFVSSSSGCTDNGSTVTCVTSSLTNTSPGNTTLLKFSITAPATAGAVSSMATVSTPGNDTVTSNNTASVDITINAKSSGGGGGGGAFGPLLFIVLGWIYIITVRNRKVIII